MVLGRPQAASPPAHITSQLAPLQVCHLGPVAGVGVGAVAELQRPHSGPEEIALVRVQALHGDVARVLLRPGLQLETNATIRPWTPAAPVPAGGSRQPRLAALGTECPVLSPRPRL